MLPTFDLIKMRLVQNPDIVAEIIHDSDRCSLTITETKNGLEERCFRIHFSGYSESPTITRMIPLSIRKGKIIVEQDAGQPFSLNEVTPNLIQSIVRQLMGSIGM